MRNLPNALHERDTHLHDLKALVHDSNEAGNDLITALFKFNTFMHGFNKDTTDFNEFMHNLEATSANCNTIIHHLVDALTNRNDALDNLVNASHTLS